MTELSLSAINATRDYADDSKYRLLTTSLKVGDVTNYLGAFLRRDNDLKLRCDG